jgi:hypothetical protein
MRIEVRSAGCTTAEGGRTMMNDRAFRLDFFIAIGALLMSVATTATLIYQTRVIHDEYAVTIWPYLSVSTTFSPSSEVIKLVNDGFGPALIRSALLSADGKPLRSWNEYAHILLRDPLAKAAVRGSASSSSTSTVDASMIVRPGEEKMILSAHLPKGVSIALLLKHPISLDFCYCSLNDSCWTLHSKPGTIGNVPTPVSHCTVGATIDSHME